MRPDHVTLICPVCEREGTVHRSLLSRKVRVVCSGGRQYPERVETGNWDKPDVPSHEPTECVPLRDG